MRTDLPIRADLAVVQRPLSALRAYERNARTHSKRQVEQIAASMREFGWTNPVLADEAGNVIAGHGRIEAARLIGMDTVPVIVLAGLTDAQRRALVLADNKLALNSGWDDALLGAELDALRVDAFDLGVIGFGTSELARLLPNGGGATDPEDVPAAPAIPVAQIGQVWQLGAHRIACGDSTDPAVVAALLGDDRPNLMVTDPPYGVEYDASWRSRAGFNRNAGKLGAVLNDDRADWREAWALFPGNVAYCWHAGTTARVVQASLEASGLEIRSQIIWVKDRFTLGRSHYHWQHELCWYAVRAGASAEWVGGRRQSTVWTIPARDDSGHGHSTQKPVECMRRPIENNSVEGDLVYEPFSGSGTTLIACEMTGRRCRAIELNPAYVDVAIARWESFTGGKATLLAQQEREAA